MVSHASPLGFGPERRLRHRAEFVRAQRTGRRVNTPHFTLLVAARAPAGPDVSSRPARLGVVTSRKIGGAVQRNRVRRLCRECFRKWPDMLPPGVDLVAIARPGAPGLGLADVEGEWRAVSTLLLKKAREALARGEPRTHLGRGKTC